jgi:hypothetical protein
VGSTAVGSGVAPQATINNIATREATVIHIHVTTLPFMAILSSRFDKGTSNETIPSLVQFSHQADSMGEAG